MTKLIKIAAVVLSISFLGFVINLNKDNVEAKENYHMHDGEICEVKSNVGDGQSYPYEITYVDNGEIHGIPLAKESCTNKGIFLFEDEVDFQLDEGDKIEVIWGENEDEFESITLIEE